MKLKNFNCMLQMLHSIFQRSNKGSLILLLLVFAIKGYGQVITIEDVSGNENDGAITLTATLTGGPVFGGFSVDVFTTDGTALVADNDYTAIVGQTLNFTGINGQTIAFDVFPTPDTNLEDSETLTISMGNLTGNFVPLDISDTATVTITNDDFGTISVVPRDTNEEGPINGRFRIVLSENNTTGSPLTLDYTLSGAAVFGAGNDYTVSGSNNAVSGTITFSATQTARNLNINPIDDSLVEGDEDVILTIDAISSPLFTMDPNTASITIADNDSPSITDFWDNLRK